jgi:alpha-L-arabinofuranosidase
MLPGEEKMSSGSGKRLRAWTRRDFVRGLGAMSLGLAARRRLGASSPEPPLGATLKVDLDRRLGEIDPNIYGNFIEHLGRCIYGGIFDEGVPLSDADGNRRDVLEAARRLRVTQLRWPGGNFSSGYHWQDGIGPKDSRPARYDLAWFQREPNRFGTDEFIATCRKLGTQPYISVNLGSGTLDEAAAWVEYCNRQGGTYFSDLRRHNGRAEPYGVKFWGLGNEIYGDWQIGHKDATDYAKAALEFAKAMKWQDPNIKLVACGDGDPNWDRPVLKSLVRHVDYISAHHYTVVDDLKDYYEILGSVAEMEALIRASAATAESISAEARKSPPVFTAFDEWNIIGNWADGSKRDEIHKYEVPYNLRDALWVASALNAIHRHCRTVRMSNLAQLVNVIAPITTSPTGILLRTIYYPLELYSNRAGRIALDVFSSSPLFQTKRFGDQPYLDALGTYDEEKRRLALAVVNRSQESDLVGTVELTNSRAKPGGRAFVITGANPDAANTFENPRAVTTQEVKFPAAGSRFEYRFPRHSISWLEFEVEAGGA